MSNREKADVNAVPVAPWQGGKRNLAKRVCALIDAHDLRRSAMA